MSIKLSRGNLLGSAAGAAAALGLMLACATQAQPYGADNYQKISSYGDQKASSYGGPVANGGPAAAGAYGYDTSATVGGVTVVAPRRVERTSSGAEVVIASVSRVVDTGDLDLSSGRGMHELRTRVESAATDACGQFDNEPGLYPLDGNDADCFHHAVDGAMSQVNAAY